MTIYLIMTCLTNNLFSVMICVNNSFARYISNFERYSIKASSAITTTVCASCLSKINATESFCCNI